MTIPVGKTKPRWRFKRITGAMTAAPNGQWLKKWKGRPYYFGVWRDQDAALADWRSRWPGITSEGGTDPRFDEVSASVNTLDQLCVAYLQSRDRKMARGKLDHKTAVKALHACARLKRVLGPDRSLNNIGPQQFADLIADASGTMGVFRRADFINIVRGMFKWAAKHKGVQVSYGEEFDPVSRKELRAERHRTRRKPLTAEAIWKLHDAAEPQFKAMILLGINAGFGNSDCSELLVSDLKLDDGMIDTIRPKTKAIRKAPLWPETAAALRAILPESGNVFLQPNGQTWVTKHDDRIGESFAAIAKRAGVEAHFYDLRRTFGSITDEIGDDRAVKLIMGQVVPDVLEVYKNERSLQRLRRVTDSVRIWLLASRPGASTSGEGGASTSVEAWASVS